MKLEEQLSFAKMIITILLKEKGEPVIITGKQMANLDYEKDGFIWTPEIGGDNIELKYVNSDWDEVEVVGGTDEPVLRDR